MSPTDKAREALAAAGITAATDAQVQSCIALAAHARLDNMDTPTWADPWARAADLVAKESR